MEKECIFMANHTFVTKVVAIALAGTIVSAIPTFAATTPATSNTDGAQHQQSPDRTAHHKNGPGFFKQVATIIGVDVKTLKQSLKAGQSIMDVAQNKGNKISEQDLITKLKANLKDNLDKKVASGKMTKEQASKIMKNSDQRLKNFVEDRALFQHHKMKHKHQYHQNGQSNQEGTPSQKTQESSTSNTSR
jgi:hypothetical protein